SFTRTLLSRSSPRAWGCTELAPVAQLLSRVVPTRVGVYRSGGRSPAGCCCRPHARGGVPRPDSAGHGQPRSSPRAWGCTVARSLVNRYELVVPTRVGVYRLCGCRAALRIGRPHARGGVPAIEAYAPGDEPSSPRAWGCTARA